MTEQEIRKRIEELKWELGPSPLNTSGLSIGDTIQRDMQFSEVGYISKWDAKRNTIDELEKLLKDPLT